MISGFSGDELLQEVAREKLEILIELITKKDIEDLLLERRLISHITNEELDSRINLPDDKWISKDPNLSMNEWFEMRMKERNKEENNESE